MATQACWGRGSASRKALLLCIGCALWCWTASATTTLMVGGSKGWTITGVNYTAWAESQTFATGDILFFPYVKGQHDVAVVSQAGYAACTSTTNDPIYITGNTNLTLNGTGSSYYICTITGHCAAGMKLAVTVGASTPSSPTSTPSSNVTNSTKSGVPSITNSQVGYFVAIFSALAGFIL